jgi:hypothetical protein
VHIVHGYIRALYTLHLVGPIFCNTSYGTSETRAENMDVKGEKGGR